MSDSRYLFFDHDIWDALSGMLLEAQLAQLISCATCTFKLMSNEAKPFSLKCSNSSSKTPQAFLPHTRKLI